MRKLVVVFGTIVALNISYWITYKVGMIPSKAEEALVRSYLLRNPKFLINNPEYIQSAIKIAEETAREEQRITTLEILSKNKRAVITSKYSIAQGKAHAPITIIVFSDYQCVPCKASYPALQYILDLELPVLIVSLQLPIEGPLSLFAARATAAASSQAGILAFHEQLMGSKLPLSNDLVLRHAEAAGLDVAALKKSMKDSSISDYLLKVRDLAEALGVKGVPAYIIDGRITHGAITEQEILDLIAKATTSNNLNS